MLFTSQVTNRVFLPKENDTPKKTPSLREKGSTDFAHMVLEDGLSSDLETSMVREANRCTLSPCMSPEE